VLAVCLFFFHGIASASQREVLKSLQVGDKRWENLRIIRSEKPETNPVEEIAYRIFLEELGKRVYAPILTFLDGRKPDEPVIAIISRESLSELGIQPPTEWNPELVALKPEGYLIRVESASSDGKNAPVVWIIGADGRGAMFGAGRLLREMLIAPTFIDSDLSIVSAPAYPIRGHQLGYRNRANSWDAWTIEQFDEHIRDLAIFGNNSIENIPFQDESSTPLMKYSRRDFNRLLGEVCDKYDQDYWVWTPVEFDLNDTTKREAELARHAEFYKDTPRLDGVFFPGGDPGHNPARLVVPFLEDIAKLLAQTHLNAKVWLSLQWFGPEDQAEVYAYLKANKPTWFGGMVCGPSSPKVRPTRALLDEIGAGYKLRNYPDITHTVRCQFPVPQWDRAFNLTLGRECINPRPVAYQYIHNLEAPYTDGFISYSDGVHDDVNKIIYNLAAWDPEMDVREGLIQYARYFIGGGSDRTMQRVADAILGLERNWQGPIENNGSIEATLAEWRTLGKILDGNRSGVNSVGENWRFQMCQLRATYDAYQRVRARHEAELQREADGVLARASELGSAATIESVGEILARPNPDPRAKELRNELDRLADALFKSIQLQTSIPRYNASEPERGCVMDFVDHPLNDRYYYEFRFPQITALADETTRVAELTALGRWADPGTGGFYDDLGNIGASPRAIFDDKWRLDPGMDLGPNTEFTWANGGNDLRRLAWQDWQAVDSLHYESLDPTASYRVVATVAAGRAITLTANGIEASSEPDPVAPTMPPASGKFGGAVALKSWAVPAGAITDGSLNLEFRTPSLVTGTPRNADLAEVWLRKVIE